MEMALIILCALLLAACAAAAISFYVSAVKVRKERLRFENLTEKAFDYQMAWNDDLSYFKFSNSLKELLINCEIKPNKDYIRSVFDSSGVLGGGGVSMCVNAMRKSGVISNYATPDGSNGLIQWRSVSFPLRKGRTRVYSLGRDISDETVTRNVTERMREELIIGLDYFRTAESNADTGSFALISQGSSVTIKTTSKICSLFGFENSDSFLLEQFYSLLKNEETLKVQCSFDNFLSGASDSLYVETSAKVYTGDYHNFTIKCRLNKDATDYSRMRTGMFFDTTSNRLSREALFSDYQRDAMTGLYNSRGFLNEGRAFLEKCVKENRRAVLVCLRIVRMQKISMLFGMNIADTLTKLYAETLGRLFEQNAVIGKVDAEDFAVLFESEDKETVEKMLKEVSIVVENYCNDDTLPTVLKEQSGFTAGACFYNGTDDVAVLYNKASVTLFSGSRYPGTVCCYFDAGIEKKIFGRDIVEQEIGNALKCGELELYYQPKIGVKSGEIVGAEALMRWNHKTQGLIMPSEFISVAEEMGIITKIDEWGMLQACIQNRMWQEKGYSHIKISVNMSQAQLYQTDVVASVKNALDESGLDASCLEVELTETMAIIDIDRTISILNSLKKLGVSISMDDFGTGYSSLSSLKILPIDLLKIDRSLVYDIETNATARRITKAIVELGKAMDLTVLAEGVENEGQRSILDQLGCDVIQGFLYSKPLPAAMIEKNFLIPQLEKKR